MTEIKIVEYNTTCTYEQFDKWHYVLSIALEEDIDSAIRINGNLLFPKDYEVSTLYKTDQVKIVLIREL